MKIKEKEKDKKFYIQEISNGDVFKYKGKYYIKCETGMTSDMGCVDLESGVLCFLHWDLKVNLIEGEFVCNQ